ncbi:hypothetical protein KY330_02805 [Candidatus Woesearchaeota archaeon]|nr:hypothetical protein [Candidatus Woesearchaeota archaeon]
MIFLIAFGGIIVFLYYSESKVPLSRLVNDGKVLSRTLTSADKGVVGAGNDISWPKLRGMNSKDYDDLRQELGVVSDFCIFLVDLEDNVIGIPVEDSLDIKYSIGADDGTILLSGRNCGGVS